MDERKGGAVFSPDRRYRYRLTRRVGGGEGAVMFLMLNPSRADETDDDPTIRRCAGFAKRWGYGTLYVVNLSPVVATKPADLSARLPEPKSVFLRNIDAVANTAAKSDLIVLAYGNNVSRFRRPPRWRHRDFDIVVHLWSMRRELHCLGRTAKGHPRHPGRLPYDTPLEEFTEEHLDDIHPL